MLHPARATCYYVDHDGLVQTVPATDGNTELKPKFGIALTDGGTRIYMGAGEVGGVDRVTYSVHESGAVMVSWDDQSSEWLAPGSWKLIRDISSVDNLLATA